MRQATSGLPSSLLDQLRDARGSVLDLCTGQNPYAPTQTALQALQLALSEPYPDPAAQAAHDSVAQRFGVDAACVLIGHGATELAVSAARAFVKDAGSVWLSVEPTQDELSLAARQVGARITRWRSVERTGQRVDLGQVAELMRLENPRVVSLWAPASPSGASVPFSALRALAEQFPETRFLVNQSWLSLSDDHTDLEQLPPDNMVCLRSLSLDYALPGVRAGYAIGGRPCIAEIAAVRAPFTANAAAAALVQLAMREPEALSASRVQLAEDRARLALLLDALSLVYTPSVAPFLLVRIARAEQVARELLERHGIAVCDATPYGLPDHVRISALPGGAAVRVKTALEHVLERRGLVRGREL